MSNQEKAIPVLNDLVHYLEDGKEGYHKAAEKIENADIKTMFNLYSQKRAEFSSELQNEISRMGAEPDHSDEWKGKLHRTWMDIRSAFTKDDTATILKECERGEEAAVERYNDALKEDIPEFLKKVLRNQHDEIQNNLKKIRQLKNGQD